MQWKPFVAIATRVLLSFIAVLSPEIRVLLSDMVVKLKKKASLTENPIDDMFVDVLAEILGVDTEA